MTYILKNWSVVETSSPYCAPELRRPKLVGEIYGRRDRFDDGDKVKTGAILDAKGKLVTTVNGSKYLLLGPPEQAYADYCKANNIVLDLENPITMK